MKKFIVLLLLLGLAFSTSGKENFILVKDSAIDKKFKVGDKISALYNIYPKSQITKRHHLADYYSTDIDINSNGKRDIEVTGLMNDVKLIGRITVFGEQFKTAIGIGPGNTLSELREKTKIIKIFHSGVGVGVNTVDIKKGFYILDSTSLDWNPENPEDIPLNEIPKNTKIIGIYIY